MHAPLRMKRVRTRRNIPWLNKNSKKLMFERDKLKLKAIKSNSTLDWNAYKTARNVVSCTLQKDKQLYYSNLLYKYKHNPKESWQTINRILGRGHNKSSISSIRQNDNIISGSNEIAETFNEYFSTIRDKIANSVDSGNTHFSSYISKSSTTFEFDTVSVDKVLHSFHALSSSKAIGVDKIPIKVLKLSIAIIAPSMTKLFNYAIQNGVFPRDWKVAKVIPLHKKGPKNLLDNYRPISILPAISKAFESILYEQLHGYLSNASILSKCQFGFRRYHSTTTALLDSTNQWYSNMDKGLLNIVAFLDLKKAFDTIDHEILIEKLNMYGVKRHSLGLLESYITNRSQKCFINGTLSHSKPIKCGIPQGSILGPLFFLVYINDLPNCLEYCTPRMFADDTTLTVCGKSTHEISSAMNHDLNNVNDWLMANKLCLNLSKTEYMLIGSRHSINNLVDNPCISVDGELLNRVIVTESLGIHIDQFLSWDFYIEKLTKKISSGIGAISRLKPFACRNTLISAYNALVQTYFDYCCEVWDPIGSILSNKLQTLQNRAARIIMGYPNEHGCSEAALTALGWKTLKERRFESKARLMYKIIHGFAPTALTEIFSSASVVRPHDYNLRNSDMKLNLPFPKTEYLKKSISFNGVKLWNDLPIEVRNAESLGIFKSLLCATSLSRSTSL